MMEFNYLTVVNVKSVMVGNCFIACHAVAIAWGDWYNQRPFSGNRNINLLSYGGMGVASIRIDQNPIYIAENKYINHTFQKGEKVELTEDFSFAQDTSSCDLFFGENGKLSITKDDYDQEFRLINFKGNEAPYGETVENWISGYMCEPNRPYMIWRPNPNRRRKLD